MPDLISPPPWKEAGTNGYKYKKTVEEGYFLEQLCIMTARINDIHLVLVELHNTLALLNNNLG